MRITVNTQNDEEQQALITFLSSNGYDYHTDDVTQLPGNELPPIISRDDKDGTSNDPEPGNRGPMKIF
jgi:hypothetical protein